MKLKQGFAVCIVGCMILFVLAWSTPSHAEYGSGQPYFSLSGMVATADSADIKSAAGTTNPDLIPEAELKTETGYGVVGALGWLLDTNWRVEAELGHRQVNLDQIQKPSSATLTGNAQITTAMINVLKDFRDENWITPYLGVGAGVGYHKLNVGQIGTASPDFGIRDAWTVTYQALAGINFEVARDMDLVVGYRYLGAWQPDYGPFALKRLDIHHFEMGLKFYFEDWIQ